MEVSAEVKEEIKLIEMGANKDVHMAIIKHARRMDPYSIGDVIKDGCQIGKIKSIAYQVGEISKSYNIVYVCERLKKDLTPFKSGEICDIYLSNIQK